MGPKTWLVTGGSSGLGLAITVAVLEAGHRVICTARNASGAAQENPRVQQLGGKWLQVDVTSPDTEHIVAQAIHDFGGQLDVVVNNAGNMLVSSLEDARIEDLRDMLETHVLGAIRVMKGVLPVFRKQRHGCVFNMSSFSGLVGHAGAGPYVMSKFALEGISESWQAELAPFNVRVVILEPGAFRSRILQRAVQGPQATERIRQEYLDTAVGKTLQLTQDMAERPEELVAGDPTRLAQRVVEIADQIGYGETLHDVLRIPLGTDARHLIGVKLAKLNEDFERSKEIAGSTDFEGHRGTGAFDL